MPIDAEQMMTPKVNIPKLIVGWHLRVMTNNKEAKEEKAKELNIQFQFYIMAHLPWLNLVRKKQINQALPTNNVFLCGGNLISYIFLD